MGDHEGTLQTKNDDISMKTKPILARFGGTFATLRFDEKYFFNTLLGFTPCWDSKNHNAVHADSPGGYTSDKFSNVSTINKIQLKCDCVNGSFVIGVQQLILYSFVLKKPRAYKLFCEPETKH